MIEVRRLAGDAVRPYLADLARLRIRVFREFPYLYDGTEGYEQDYLESYAASERSVIVIALSDGEVIGVSTGLPLSEADPAFREPFEKTGVPVESVFYLGESVLEPAFRGRGLGHRFFDEREAHAAEYGFPVTAFCAVERADDHPLKPDGYVSHDTFWSKRSYIRRPDLQARLSWKQIDAEGDVENILTFRVKR